jgi:hypothetical protein
MDWTCTLTRRVLINEICRGLFLSRAGTSVQVQPKKGGNMQTVSLPTRPNAAAFRSLAFIVILAGCGSATTSLDTTQASVSARGAASEDQAGANIDFHIGDAFLASLNPAFSGGDRAKASNGDTVTIVGRGKFEVKEGEAEGSGIFVHQTPNGHLLGTGTWRAKKLLHFDNFGGQSGFPPDFRGGHAVLSVRVVGHSGGDPTVTEEFDAVLTVDCAIGEVPAGLKEGITFEIPGLVKFDAKVFGVTLFVATRD